MKCTPCAETGQPIKSCEMCGVEFCRHNARRQTDENGVQAIVCLEPFECLKRVGRAIRT